VTRRIVSLVPSMTETVCCLDAAAALVGVTRYCVEPAALLRDIPRVGGTKNPDLERIAALRPDLVLVNSEENRAEHIAWLRARAPVLEQWPRTVVEAAASVRELAVAIDALEAAQPILLHIEAQIAAAEVQDLGRDRVRVFYAIWRDPWMSISRDTYIHDVLQRAGGANVCAGLRERYPKLEPQQLAGLDVDLVLLSSEPYPFDDRDRSEVVQQVLFGAGVPVMLCDGRDFCWHGARTAEGLGRACQLLSAFRRPR
jgi:ABC-type Fe3+-hydroxamate transport system substrate-binding protein